MGQIALEGMAFYSHHGYYTEERKRGNNYIVDVFVDYNLEAAADSDDLHKAVNYEQIYTICETEMNNPRHLIESVAKSIAHSIKKEFPDVEQLSIHVRKLAPELGGTVKSANGVYTM